MAPAAPNERQALSSSWPRSFALPSSDLEQGGGGIALRRLQSFGEATEPASGLGAGSLRHG